ncbi:uncharacterized protein (DUF849 family) [Planomicrobium soli]|uniref:Uncharacterized protein (DUF849 family) n=1 Tax=Planomicrobium soli TaxID=1176648 RepID=A0A2P8H214_9BACL|nr:3-keto-5-aminohexanoate cleavage protein [Planomicrobium soli]PSL40251.1 uncharacterized protein (DUF849 family) [Planomicrobium soli]
MVIQVCLNGGRTKQEHARVPITLDEIIKDIHILKNLGVEHFHIHLRDGDGKETFENRLLAPQMQVLRQQFPDIKIGLSTNLFDGMTPEIRLRQINGWRFNPDYVSVNLSEPGSLTLWEVLKNKAIKTEAGIWTMDDAELFTKNKLDEYCERVLIEVFFWKIEEAVYQASRISAFLAKHAHALEQVHHGEEINTWSIADHALKQKHGTRIGLEDTLVSRDAKPAVSNEQLYKELMRL